MTAIERMYNIIPFVYIVVLTTQADTCRILQNV